MKEFYESIPAPSNCCRINRVEKQGARTGQEPEKMLNALFQNKN